jgi:hypothetical protein
MSIALSPEKDRKKLIAAIIAGVSACIEEEERAREAVTPQRRAAMVVALWPILGREEIMRMRTLWQRRMV